MRSARSAVVFAIVIVAACGGVSAADHAHKALQTTLSAVNAARDEFVAWDAAYQQELVARNDTREDAEAALAGYRAKREPVLRAFTVAYTTIGAAAAIVPLVEQGLRSESDLLTLLRDAAEATAEVKRAYEAIRGL